jgi:hypothetical protein
VMEATEKKRLTQLCRRLSHAETRVDCSVRPAAYYGPVYDTKCCSIMVNTVGPSALFRASTKGPHVTCRIYPSFAPREYCPTVRNKALLGEQMQAFQIMRYDAVNML